jgi:predicted ATPase
MIRTVPQSNPDFSPHHFPRVKIRGIFIDQKVGPIEERFFEIGSGTTVVYGRNGAGKSYLLNALSSVANAPRTNAGRGDASSKVYFTSKCPLLNYGTISRRLDFFGHNPWHPMQSATERNYGFEWRHGHWSDIQMNPLISQDELSEFERRVERIFWIDLGENFDDLINEYLPDRQSLLESESDLSYLDQIKKYAKDLQEYFTSPDFDPDYLTDFERRPQWQSDGWDCDGYGWDTPFERVFDAVMNLACANYLWKVDEFFELLIRLLTRIVLRGEMVIHRDGSGEMVIHGDGIRFVTSPHDSVEGQVLVALAKFARDQIIEDGYFNRDDWWTAGEEWFGGLAHELSRLIDDDYPGPSHHHDGIEIESGRNLPSGPSRIITEIPESELVAVTIEAFSQQLNNQKERQTDAGNVPTDSLLIDGQNGAFAISQEALSLANAKSLLATDYFHRLMQSQVVLNCALNPINRWKSEGVLEWRCLPNENSEYLPIQKLSNAELRWACVAIQLAMLEIQEGAAILVIDEPESGLHRRAERFLANGLHNLTSEMGIQLVVATHSPSFLKLKDAQLVHIYTTSDGVTEIEELNPELSSRVDEFGLDKSDLLQLCRLFVVVEGLHDEIVLKELFGTELSNAGIEVFCLRGLKNLKNSSDAQLLFKFTDANVIYVTDNENGFRIEEIWSRAQVTDQDQQLGVLSEITLGRKSNEAGFLKEFMKMALDMNSKNRMHFAALDAPDILEYLPVAAFTGHKSDFTWASLREEFATVEKATDFKKWLTEKYKFDFSEENVREACLSLDNIHSDLTSLLTTLLDLANI